MRSVNTFIGSPVERVEDLRFLRGRGQYVPNCPFGIAGNRNVCFASTPSSEAMAWAQRRGVPHEFLRRAITKVVATGAAPVANRPDSGC